MASQFILLTTLFNEKDPARRTEYLYCLNRNKNNPRIKSITIFYQKADSKDDFIEELENCGASIHLVERQPTYHDFFEYSNTYLVDRNIILCNADIYFDSGKGLNLLEDVELGGLFFTLTRYNKLPHIRKLIDEYPNQQGLAIETGEGRLRSQHLNGSSIDTWIYKSPINIDFR